MTKTPEEEFDETFDDDYDPRTMEDMVKEFHVAYGVPVIEVPEFPSWKRIELRDQLEAEEYEEFVHGNETRNLIEAADAIGDQIYVLIGRAIEYGIPIHEIFTEIHRSNMSKLGEDGKPIYREDGKILKGPNYSPPDIKSILIAHGWKEKEEGE